MGQACRTLHLNMGAIEMATRLIIARLKGHDGAPIFSDDLAARVGYVRKRYPRDDKARHERAMRTFEVAMKHVEFRNVVAHSPIAIRGNGDGTYTIRGIMNITPKDQAQIAELISLEELKGRVNESATIARRMLEMQDEFPIGADV